MTAGHFALAAGVKAWAPRLPLWALMLSTYLLDVIFILLLTAGIEGLNMKTTKRASKKKPANREAGPEASRPHIPGYGIPRGKTGLLPWSHVTERMARAMHYWISTVSPDGRPHATPVDGLWLEDQLYFSGSPQTRRNRNLAANPAVCIHLESGVDVIILHGDAHELHSPDRSLAIRLSEASAKKYGYGLKPEEYETADGVYVFRPREVFAWKQFPRDATRWRIESGG